MSIQKMKDMRCVNMRFIVFLKSALAKMVANKFLESDFINLEFWLSWPRKFYNVKTYDFTKEDFETNAAEIDDTGFDTDADNNDDTQSHHSEDRQHSNNAVSNVKYNILFFLH